METIDIIKSAKPIIVLVNAPKHSGKTSLCSVLENTTEVRGVVPARQAKEMTYTLLPRTAIAYKDTKINGRKTPRQYCVQMIEGFLKPIYGKDIIARHGVEDTLLCLSHMFRVMPEYWHANTPVFFIDNFSGHDNEIQPWIDTFGSDRILILQIERNDCPWGTYRKPFDKTQADKLGLRWGRIENNGDLDEAAQNFSDEVNRHFGVDLWT